MRKIDQLKAILDSQVVDPDNWPVLDTKIEGSVLDPSGSTADQDINLTVHSVEVGFAFDKTGEKFLGIFNWKE